MSKDLRALPKLRDSISYLYIERAIIEQDASSIVAIKKDGRIPIPISSVTCLMLGPGISVTHAAIKAICDNGCMAVWCGEHAQRFYASGIGETRSAHNLLAQARLCMDEQSHLNVAKRMYLRRFGSITNEEYTIKQLRGMEGIRVREAYRLASRQTGVQWKARDYKQQDWNAADSINQALSQANAILYSVCHAAVVSLGFSPGLGFIHTGKQLSFVYDIADLYKADITIPAAFVAVSHGGDDLSTAVRRAVRSKLAQVRLMKRIPEDIEWIFRLNETEQRQATTVGMLWDETGEIQGGQNFGGDL